MPTLTRLAPLTLLASLSFGCAALDNTKPSPWTPTNQTARPAHGPRLSDNGWVVTVTADELAALGLGQQMELDVRAPDVVYVVDYGRAEQLDAVFARTPHGLLPLRGLMPDETDGAGRVVLRTTSKAASQPTSQPTSLPTEGEGA